jgi:mannose-1-phosphate guanylyltransferase/mannose-6-phosphate isomerase
MIIPVILSGGSGKRLWPLSRKQHPKQFLPLSTDKTLLQETLLRLEGIKNIGNPIIVCNSDHRFLVAEQCNQIGINKPIILLEPVGKNTAPAIAAAAFYSESNFQDAILLVLSADHLVQDVKEFHKSINLAIIEAKKSKLVIFGVKPISANTNYGYIKISKSNKDKHVYQVENYVEKPDIKTAESYLNSGNYLWNSGMFIFKSNTLIKELSVSAPDVVSSIKNAVKNAIYDLDFIRLNKEDFLSSPSDSIDYALMEVSENVVVVTLDAKWCDIGSWSALYDIGNKDKSKNVIKGNVFAQNTASSYISSNNHLVATLGVDNLIIVDTTDVTFVANRDNVEELKSLVESLQDGNFFEASNHRKVFRPWGWYDSISNGNNFQVKKIHINPGAKLSLQMHHKRSEHWIVVSGKATAIIDEQVLTLNQDESTYISIGMKHSLENNTTEPLEIIEVQSGTYFGEDDIVRFEDIYGRVKNK